MTTTRLLFMTLALMAVLSIGVNADQWISLAHAFQRKLQQDVTLELQVLPTSHNAYNIASNLPPLLVEYMNLVLFKGKLVFVNQVLTMTQQLNLGVRHLAIDGHYIPKYGTTLMCHGGPEAKDACPLIEGGTGLSCFDACGIEDLGNHTGCTTSARTWGNGIDEIADWIDANPNEYVVIEIEDDVSSEPAHNSTAFLGPLQDRLVPVALTKTDLDDFRATTGRHWPTPAEMKSMYNKTVFIFGIDTDLSPEAAEFSLDTQMNIVFPHNNANEFSPLDCNGLTPNFTIFGESGIKVDIHILGFNITDDGTITTGWFARPVGIQEVVNCGFTPSMDMIGDEVMSALVWTWKAGVVDIACRLNECASIVQGDTYWTQQPCNSTGFVRACVSDTDSSDWTLGTSNSCPSSYSFKPPVIPTQNQAVLTLLQANPSTAGVFLNVTLTYDPSNSICSYTAQSSAGAVGVSFLFTFLVALLVTLLQF